MASFVIEGGHKLHGEIVPQGAKNEVLEVICYQQHPEHLGCE